MRTYADQALREAVSLDEFPDAGKHGSARIAGAPLLLPSPAEGVALWMFALVRDPPALLDLEALLSPEELVRAGRFGTVTLRERYVAGRGTLRLLLGTALGRAPEKITIQRGPRGRPQLEDAKRLDFNVTHTAGVALVGVCAKGRIGVDIEHRDRDVNVAGVSRKFMSPREQAALAELEPDVRRRALLRLWTCKEAMSKATGDALSAPFSDMDVAATTKLALQDGPPPYVPDDWRLLPAAAPETHIATVALWTGPN